MNVGSVATAVDGGCQNTNIPATVASTAVTATEVVRRRTVIIEHPSGHKAHVDLKKVICVKSIFLVASGIEASSLWMTVSQRSSLILVIWESSSSNHGP